MSFWGTLGSIASAPVTAPIGLVGGLISSPVNDSENKMTRPVANIDDGTSQLMNDQSARANQGEDYYTNQQMAGVGNHNDLAAAQEQVGQSAASQGGNNALMGQALQARGERNYGQNVSALQRRAQLLSPAFQNQQQQLQGHYANLHTQMALSNLARQHEAADEQYKARVGIVGSVLGGIGSLSGMALGKMGGPKSAATPLADAGGIGAEQSMPATGGAADYETMTG